MITCPLTHTHGEVNPNSYQLISTRIREGEGRIVKCPACGLVMQDLDWQADKIEDYYNTEYQLTNSLMAGQMQTAREHYDNRMQTIQPAFDKVKPLLRPDMKVLEIGCGAGELLSLVKPLVKSCVGVEMYQPFVEFIQTELGIEAYASDLIKLEWGQREFDLVICMDSLDHMPNPLEVLTFIRGLLVPGGNLWVTVPNLNEALNYFLPEPNLSRYREFFWHRAHFFYFSAETLTRMLDAVGFNVIEIDTQHQYTLKNYLKWYFTGQPQPSFLEASKGVAILPGTDPFENDMNAIFTDMEVRFQEALRQHGRADTLWCYASARP